MGHASNTAFADRVVAARNQEINRASARDVLVAADLLPLRSHGAAILDAILTRHRLTNATVAAYWHCEEWITRQIRSGDRELTATKILALPDDVAEEVLLELLDVVAKRKGGNDGPTVDPVAEAQTLTIEAARALDAARTGDSDALLTASAKVAASAKKVAKAAKGAKK